MEPEAVPMEVAEEGIIRSLPLLQLVKTEQAQNGVKHSDYKRYRYADVHLPMGASAHDLHAGGIAATCWARSGSC